MMKLRSLKALLMATMTGGLLHAQQSTQIAPLPSPVEPISISPLLPVQPTGLPPSPLSLTGCTNFDSLSTATNMYSITLSEQNPIAVDNTTNTMVFVHRNNSTALGGHSGQIRYDFSTNGGASWTSNQGPVNPASVNGTNGGRYPSVAIHNPSGNTNPANAYLAYLAPTVATTWNGHVTGVRKLNGTGNTETYNQAGATQTLIPRGLCNGASGVLWAIDAVYNGTVISGYQVLKGVWNGTNDFVWSVNTILTPPFNLTLDGNPKNADFNIAFDPSGNVGWVCILGHLNTGGAAYGMYPIFYKTTNGGATWSGPEQIDVSQYACISSNIVAGNFPALAFDMDLAVDVNGNPHALVTAANGDNAYGVFFTQWHAMYDITLDHGVWNTAWVDNALRGRGTWGTAPNTVTQDLEPQLSRSADGTKIFFFWTDADSNNVNANQQPNLRGRAYDVQARKWTSAQEFTECSPSFNGKAMFPKASTTALNVSGGHEVPFAMGRFLTVAQDPLVTTSFQYLDSVGFYNYEYVVPQCVLPVTISNLDTITSCTPVFLNAGTGSFFKWNTGATTSGITESTSGWYSVAVNTNCCVGWDSVYVDIQAAPMAMFNTTNLGLNYSFTDLSAGSPTSWFWDFGDGNSSSLQSPSHTFAAAGNYNVCLTVTNSCSTSTSCQFLIVTCPQPAASFLAVPNGLSVSFTDQTGNSPSTFSWDFGDGNTSSLQSPSHTYLATGSYNVCLVASNACGADTICQVVSVCEPVVAQWNVTTGTGPTFSFNDLSSGGAVNWSWNFGDGNGSTAQNPTHTFAQAGLYNVCLIVSSGCDSDTLCADVNAIVGNLSQVQNHWIDVHPNPAHTAVRVSAIDLGIGEWTLEIRNVLGQQVSGSAGNHLGGDFVAELDVAAWPRGVYFVRLSLLGKSAGHATLLVN